MSWRTARRQPGDGEQEPHATYEPFSDLAALLKGKQ